MYFLPYLNRHVMYKDIYKEINFQCCFIYGVMDKAVIRINISFTGHSIYTNSSLVHNLIDATTSKVNLYNVSFKSILFLNIEYKF